jgi:hypothetical protein
MATVKFYLNHPYEKQTEEEKADSKPKVLRKDEVSVDMMFSINRENRFPLSTGERITPKYWDKKAQEAKPSFTGSIEMNLHLRKIKQDVINTWRENKDKSLSELKELILPIVRGKSSTTQKKEYS